MIEARAIVRELRDDGVRVAPLNPGNCPRCAEGRGCGGGILARLTQRRRPDLWIAGRYPELAVGDVVVLGIDEGAVLSASLWAYLVPLLAMLALGAFADRVLEASQALVLLFGAAGLAGGLLLTARRARRAAGDPRFRPVLLRRERGPAACARMWQAAD